jgi:hypothetical protein
MAFIENSTDKAIEKATKGTATVTGTPNVDSDFSAAQTYHVFSWGTTKVEIERCSSDAVRPAYFVADAITSFSSALANIRLPSSKSGSPSAVFITYPALQATIIPVTAVEQIVSRPSKAFIDGRGSVWQVGKREDRPGLPIQVLRDEQDNTWAKFFWDAKSRSDAFGRLSLVDTGVKQDLLDQIVATAVAQVFQ